MDNIKKSITDYLIENKISTSEVADALGKCGSLPNLFPINKGHYCVGAVKWLYAYDESNWSLHEQLCNLENDRIVFIETFSCNNRAIFGELVSKYILLHKQNRAIVVTGYTRDTTQLIEYNWPIWCEGYNPVGCYNKKPAIEFDKKIYEEHSKKYNDAIAVCDDCGVVIIPKDKITSDFLQQLQFIRRQEEIWFDRLDNFNENTFQIVCEKRYLNDMN